MGGGKEGRKEKGEERRKVRGGGGEVGYQDQQQKTHCYPRH